MPVTPHDRPIDALREETVDQLIMNYGHGKLSREAFERRLDEALDTKSHDRLLELTRDLDLKTDRQYAAQKKAELGIRVDPTAAGSRRRRAPSTSINVFAGNHRRGAWHVPRAIRIDQRVRRHRARLHATRRFTAETTRITVFCLFGGVNISRARRHAHDIEGDRIFGGVDNRAPSTTDPNAPVLVVEGFVLFGGIDIRVKKTPKQRFHEFAEHVRTMFDAQPPRA